MPLEPLVAAHRRTLRFVGRMRSPHSGAPGDRAGLTRVTSRGLELAASACGKLLGHERQHVVDEAFALMVFVAAAERGFHDTDPGILQQVLHDERGRSSVKIPLSCAGQPSAALLREFRGRPAGVSYA